MCAVQWVLLKSCIFGLCISVTEAGVVLATFDGKNTYSIGSEVELVCSITPYNNEMTWFVNNDPYADCIVGTCNPYSNKPYAFSFTFNETAGVFKLAIGSVTYSHADLSFACDDGIERKQISFNVTAVTNEGNGDHDLSTLSSGAIAGIVIGCVVFFCIIILTIVLHCRMQFMEKGNNIRGWMKCKDNFRIMMQETIWKMEDQRKDELCQKIEKGKDELYQKIKKGKDELCQKIEKDKQRSGHKETIWKMEVQLTYPATREPTLENQLEWIKEIIWMTEQDIEHIFEEINEEEGSMRTIVFSSVIMQVLQEDKDAYDNIKQATKRRK